MIDFVSCTAEASQQEIYFIIVCWIHQISKIDFDQTNLKGNTQKKEWNGLRWLFHSQLWNDDAGKFDKVNERLAEISGKLGLHLIRVDS